MDNNLVFYNSVKPQIDQLAVYRRLGYTDLGPLDKKRDKEIAFEIEEALTAAVCRAVVKKSAIDSISEEKVVFGENMVFLSRDLAAMLKGCSEIIIMGATISLEFMDIIARKTEAGRLSSAVIYDAVGGVCVDNCLDWLTSRIRSDILRSGKDILTCRFSAGFGDFLLDNQKKIYDILKMDTMGVEITDTFLLRPEKSVTAVTGIK